jgi:tRNA-Thr(GGU) m(6)t(6)A37 methyltransferase TsaA
MTDDSIRDGEHRLAFDPAETASDAHLVFIGRIRSPYLVRRDCPHNPREARERGSRGSVEVAPPWRAGLAGLTGFSHVILLYWMHEARRDLIVQAPRHAPEPRGVFALRSPVRPNPIALSVVRVLRLDEASGVIEIDAVDCLDGTPLIDIKPYYPAIDAVSDAKVP